jgi:hypothetical protein
LQQQSAASPASQNAQASSLLINSGSSSVAAPVAPVSSSALKCGGSTSCKEDRAALMGRLENASTPREQIDLIELMIGENRFFKRLWDKLDGNPSETITLGALCGKCKPFYQQKIVVLRCLKFKCENNLVRMVKYHGSIDGNMINGKFVMDELKTLCKHKMILEDGTESVVA